MTHTIHDISVANHIGKYSDATRRQSAAASANIKLTR